MPLQSRLGTSPRARCSPHQVPDRREAPSPRLAAGRPRCLGLSRVSGAGRDEEGRGQGQDREPRPSPRRQRGVDAAGRRRWPLRSARACGALRGSLWRDPGRAAPPASPLAPPRVARADPALGPCARPPGNAGTTGTAPGRAARRAGLSSNRERLSPRSAAESPRAAPPPGALLPPTLGGCQPAAPFPGPLARGCPTAGPVAVAVEPQARVLNRLVARLEEFHANVHFLFLGSSYQLVFLFYTLWVLQILYDELVLLL